MTDYCRLCAELKDFCEIVTSIDVVEQSMEQKLRVCCQWTTEDTEKQLPHSVCAICLDKLDKCWLFSQSVQLAQQKLLEIFENGAEAETKPSVAVLVQAVYNSVEFSNSIPSTSNVQSDELNHQSSREHKCEICCHRFDTVVKLNEHRQQQGCEGLIDIVSNDMNFKPTVVDFTDSECDLMTDECPAIDDFHLNVNKKMKIPQSSKRLKQQLANKSSQSKKQRNKTKLSNMADCPFCGKSYAMKYTLKRHLLAHVKNSKGDLKIEKTNNKFWIVQKNGCDPICIDQNLYECERCNRIFPHKSELRTHFAEKHSTVRPFECWLCHKTFKLKNKLKYHMKDHEKKFGWICELCGKTYTHKQTLKEHKYAVHSGGGPLECDACGKFFKSKKSLSNHRVSHSNQRFKCTHCDKSYSIEHNLERHLEAHAKGIPPPHKQREESAQDPFTISTFELLPFKCTCGLGYKSKELLQKHRTTHMELQYKCTQCDRAFRRKYCLKVHMELHTGVINKPNVCDVCGKGFRKNRDLTEHRRIHTGEKPFVCEHCTLNFRTMSTFYIHLRKVHGISVSERNREERVRATELSTKATSDHPSRSEN